MGGDATGDGDDADPQGRTASAKGSSSLTTHSGAASSVPPRSLSGSMTGSGETGSEEKATSTLKKPEPTCQQCGGEGLHTQGAKEHSINNTNTDPFEPLFRSSPRVPPSSRVGSAPLTALLDAMPTSPRGTRAQENQAPREKEKGRLGNRNRRSFRPPLVGPGAEPYASEKEPKVVSASRPAPWWLASCLVSRNLTAGLQNRGNLRSVSVLCTV